MAGGGRIPRTGEYLDRSLGNPAVPNRSTQRHLDSIAGVPKWPWGTQAPLTQYSRVRFFGDHRAHSAQTGSRCTASCICCNASCNMMRSIATCSARARLRSLCVDLALQLLVGKPVGVVAATRHHPVLARVPPAAQCGRILCRIPRGRPGWLQLRRVLICSLVATSHGYLATARPIRHGTVGCGRVGTGRADDAIEAVVLLAANANRTKSHAVLC